MRPQIRMAGLLLAVMLAIASQTIQLPRFDQSLTNPVPRPVLFSARESLAAINQFIADGDLGALWQTLDRVGLGLVPWPESGQADRDQIALAFRATFPRLRLDLASIEPSKAGYEVRLRATDATASVPVWLERGVPPDFSMLQLAVSSDDGQSLHRLTSQPSSSTLIASAPNPGAPFPLSTPSRLFSARVTLIPSETSVRYLAVHAPALITPQSGPLQLNGAGRLFVLPEGGDSWTSLIANESTTLRPGDVLYLPSGHAILTMKTSTPVSFIIAGVAAAQPLSQTTDEDGRPFPADLAQLAGSPNAAPTSTWFGSVEPQMTHAIASPNGLVSLAASWVVLPPGTKLAPDPDAIVVSCDLSEGAPSTWGAARFEPWKSATSQPTVLFVARLIPAEK